MTISAKIVADSTCNDKRITTFELQYPRFIHSELMTHRVFSRNAASSRAIPIEKMMEQVLSTPATPVEWGLNQPGMQAKQVHSFTPTCVLVWNKAAKRAVESAKELQGIGLHKQIVNRVLEPFQIMKTIVTATEFKNFFWLRCHKDAQPEIHVLANLMKALYDDNEPAELKYGEWHLPYVSVPYDLNGVSAITDALTTLLDQGKEHTPNSLLVQAVGGLANAKKISASCCAQVSYRKLDDSLDKALKIYDQLVTMTPVHASPFEHQATPMEIPYPTYPWQEEGVTHTDNEREGWSGNFQGWIQHRQLVKDNVVQG
jgi:hypothetical protein